MKGSDSASQGYAAGQPLTGARHNSRVCVLFQGAILTSRTKISSSLFMKTICVEHKCSTAKCSTTAACCLLMAPSLHFHLTATARPPALSVVSWGSWSGASGLHLRELRVLLGTVPTPSGGQAGWRWDGPGSPMLSPISAVVGESKPDQFSRFAIRR